MRRSEVTRYAHDLTEAALRRRLPGWLRRSVLKQLAQVWPKADWLPRPLRAKTLLTNLSLEAGPAYANTLTLCRQPLRRRLMGADPRGTLNGHDPGSLLRESFATAPRGDVLGGMIAADVAVILPDDFLVKVDRASMAHGLEVRPPLVDHELMELAARIPSRWKVHDGQTKWIFKHAYRQILPDSILRRPKQGFEIPIDDWLRGPLRPMFESAVLDPKAPISALVEQKAAQQIYCLPSHRHKPPGKRALEPVGPGQVVTSLPGVKQPDEEPDHHLCPYLWRSSRFSWSDLTSACLSTFASPSSAGEDVRPWGVPPGDYSRVVGIALLAGWALRTDLAGGISAGPGRKSLAVELAPDRIRVCAIAPVATDTPVAEFSRAGARAARKVHCHGAARAPGDAAGYCQRGVVLASADAEFVTGNVVEVDGGRSV